MVNYNEAMQYLENASKGTALGLYSIGNILRHLGNPEKNLRIIHVGGTNGKGSTSTFIAEMLEEMGYRVGLYTSPFLEEFNERIQINKKNIANSDLAEMIGKTKIAIDKYVAEGNPEPTEFEITTAAAYQYFYEQQVDWVVLEVGLGGELDATNTCEPALSVLTSISIDHVDYLGDDLLKIAQTKAGIIKENKPAVLYHQSPEVEAVIKNRARDTNSQLVITNPDSLVMKSGDIFGQTFDVEVLGRKFNEISISMTGAHQVKNFVTALTAICLLEQLGEIRAVNDDEIKKAAKKAKWKGRTELLLTEPMTILDGAHNLDGASVLSKYIKDFLADKEILLVFGMLKDKDIDGTLSLLAPLAKNFVVTLPDSPRAATADEMSAIIKKYQQKDAHITVRERIEDAVEYAQAFGTKENATIIYAGSLYMIGAARTALRKKYNLG